MIIFPHLKSCAQNQQKTSWEDPGSGLKWATWTQYVLFYLVSELIGILQKTVAKQSKCIVFTGEWHSSVNSSDSTAYKDWALLTASTNPVGKMGSASVVKFIAVRHAGIHMLRNFCTLMMMICSRPGWNLWWRCKDTALEWLGLMLATALAGVGMLHWHHAPSRQTSPQASLAVVSCWERKRACIWKKTPTKQSLRLDGVHDTLPWQSGLGCSCTVGRKCKWELVVWKHETYIFPHTAEFLCFNMQQAKPFKGKFRAQKTASTTQVGHCKWLNWFPVKEVKKGKTSLRAGMFLLYQKIKFF